MNRKYRSLIIKVRVKLCSLYKIKYIFHFRYMTTGCTALRLILRNFASVIASNVRSGGVGVDIPREERIARCRRCKDLLLDIRGTLQTRRPQRPRLTSSFTELQNLIDQSFH